MIHNETSMLINQTAFRLLAGEGYAKLTYQKIANACGVERALVQYYFPKKQDFATKFWRYLLELAADYVESCKKDVDERMRPAWALAVHYGYLLSSPKLRSLTMELIDSRQITDNYSDIQTEWAFEYIGMANTQNDTATLLKIGRKLTGNLLDDLYHKLKMDEEISAKDIAFNYAQLYQAELKTSKKQRDAIFAENDISENVIKKGVSYISKRIG